MALPTEITVTLDLDKHLARERYYDPDTDQETSEPATLEGLVLDRLLASLVAKVTSDRDYVTGIADRLNRIRDEALDRLLEPLLVEAINRSFQPTNRYGESSCEATTLSDVIVARAEAWLRESPNDYNSRGTGPRIDRFIAEATGREFTKRLQAAAAEGEAEVKAAMREAGAKMLADIISRAAKG